jgi:hypothetical protein
VNAEKLIGAEASVALVGVIASDLIGTPQDQRTLPKPRRIMGVFVFYSILSLMTALGQGPARFAAAAGGVLAITSLVLGATGRTIIDVIQRSTGLLTGAGSGTGAGAAGPSPGSGSGSPSNPNPVGSPGDAPPGYHYAQGPGGKWSLIPNNPNEGGAVTATSARVRLPATPAGGFV